MIPPAVLEAPLTEPQIEILLSAQLGDNASCAYNESLSLDLVGPLDRPALCGALDDLVARHDALRARIDGDRMLIAPHLPLPIDEWDCSAGAPACVLDEAARTPFDLLSGPLLRATLVRRAAEDHGLVLTFHHVICDGWSTNVMLTDLAVLYDQHHTGSPAALAPAPSFAAHALAERMEDAATAAVDERYWIDRFNLLPASLELPTDRPRPAIKTFRGATLRETIDGALYQAVRGAGARIGCTPFATMLSAFQLLLGRLADQQEVVVGVPTAGQSLLDDRALVGHCVNFLPIAGCWDSTTTLAQHMVAVQATLVEAREHPRCTLGTLVRRLGMTRTPNRQPLTDVQFNLERMDVPVGFGGLRVAATANPKAFVNFDLFFNLVETEDGLRLDCDYSTDLFDEATVRRWIGHYRSLLVAIITDVGSLSIRAKLLDEPEMREMLSMHNDTTVVTADRGFHDLFAEQARRRPDAIAAECGEARWTYRELDRRADEVATFLRARFPEGDARIGVLMERSLDLLAALLAVAKAGFAYVPLDPHQPPARLLRVIERSGLAALLTDGLAPVPDCAVRLIDLSRRLYPVAVSVARAVPRPVNPLAYVIYTSGSTGLPKGVEIGHYALTNLLVSMAAQPGLHEDDALLALTTVAFDIAALELFLPLTVGARVVIARRDELLDGFALLSRMRSRDVTMIQVTPSMWLLLEAGFRSHPGLKMLCGGEALPRELADRLSEGGGALWNMYGPTEATIWSSAGLVRPDRGPISIGRPIANTRFHLLDRHGELTLPGARGQLHIGGDGLAEGYSDPAQTAAGFIADPFVLGGRLYRTGDLARRLPDGEIQLLGRLDNQVKLRGFRIELGEIEAALLSAGGVAAASVLLRTDPPRAARLVAYYVELPDSPRGPPELEAAIAEILPAYMVPAAFVRLESLPLTPNGKVDREALPVPHEHAHAAGDAARVAFGTPLQRRLGAIWQEVLGLQAVGAEDDLLALGADSIHIFQIAARASRAGLAVAAKDILRHRTIAALSAALELPSSRSDRVTGLPKLSQFRRVEHCD